MIHSITRTMTIRGNDNKGIIPHHFVITATLRAYGVLVDVVKDGNDFALDASPRAAMEMVGSITIGNRSTQKLRRLIEDAAIEAALTN